MSHEKVVNWIVATAAVLTAATVILDRAVARSSPTGYAGQSVEMTEGWESLSAAGHRVGADNAPLTMVEFIDVECPACLILSRALDGARSKLGDKLAIAFVHYPLPIHRNAEAGARAVACAAEQGRVYEMISETMARRDSLAQVDWERVATVAGVGRPEEFLACLESPVAKDAVQRGLDAGAMIGVNATPTVILNGWRFRLTPTEKELLEAAEALLEGKAPPFRVRASR